MATAHDSGLWTPGEKEFGGGVTCTLPWRPPPAPLDRIVARLDELQSSFEGPVEHEGGDRSLYCCNPEGSVVEVWNFFTEGEGERHRVAALH